MFDIGKKITRAWRTLWDYKVLWIFAFLLALAGGSTINGSGSGGGGSRYTFNSTDGFRWDRAEMHRDMPAWMQEAENWVENNIVPLFTPERAVNTIVWLIVILFAIGLVVSLLLALVRYPSETALLRMVDQYEQDGTKLKFKQGWALGWNIRAFRIWVIDLIIGLPGLLIGLSIAIGAAIFAFNAAVGSIHFAPDMVGMIILAGLVFFLLAVVMVFVGLWRQFIVRSIAIDGADIGGGFKQGWYLLIGNFKHAVLTWLVMAALRIAFSIAFALALIVLIPVIALMILPAAVVGAIPGAIAFAIASIFTTNLAAWMIGGIAALVFFIPVAGSPATLVASWFDLFSSSIWTQTYREMKAPRANALVYPSEVVPPALG